MKHILAVLLGGCLPFAADGAPVDYLSDVKPLLATHCYKCHGATQQKNGLRLDTAAAALKGGERGPAIKPGRSEDSLLIQVVRGTHPEVTRMPYKRTPLEDAAISTLAAWIDAGAGAPENESPDTAKHWAFIPPVRPPVPAVAAAKHPVDAFVLARLEEEKISPAPEADPVTLLRRLHLDLTGLPPSPAEVDAFMAQVERTGGIDKAYAAQVDRLLASPHYGERWGRHWLDVARYADSNGYSIDAPRTIWPYRDWVVSALNRDLPFDQFVIEQLAGDMLSGATQEQRIATGFHRNTQINQEGGIDKEQFRIESVIDRVSTTGTAFLGLTVSCAQCHDHKFDPVTQREFFGLYAFLNNADEPDLPLAPPDKVARAKKVAAEVDDYLTALAVKDPGIWKRMVQWEQHLTPAQRQAMPEAVRAAFDVAFDKRTAEQRRLELAEFIEHAEENKNHRRALRKLRAAVPEVLSTMVMQEREQPRRSYLFIKGDFTRDGGDIGPAVPAVLHPMEKQERPNRLDLARWIVDSRNPLLARVTVNRMWQQYFGRGLVETENDFGTQGSPPSHPGLLDWLATEFMAQKWSQKAMHRLIVNSATYRQSSRVRPELNVVDPLNRLLARQSRLRLDAEIVRDAALSASGLLNPKVGGPPVFPPIPNGVMSLGQVKREWKVSEGADRYRRGLYTFIFRATPPPSLAVFDAPDAFSACTRRLRSNTPLQALTLLNDEQFFDLARALAKRILREAPGTDAGRLDFAFRLCTARPPGASEKKTLKELLAQELARREPIAGAPDGVDAGVFGAWTSVARVLLNLDETITRE
jgi:cytochrome c553